MGLIAQCDGGCGETTKDIKMFDDFGIIKKVWYCKDCQADLEALYASRDALQTIAVTSLKADLLGSC